MPLVIMTGYPCCGKTTFSLKLAEYLKENGIPMETIEIVNEESQNIKKSEAYATSLQEKSTRGVLKSAVNHKLNDNNYVISDSLNYIKGYRYELYCSTRSFRTPHCVVWVESDEVLSNNWNEAREDKYDSLM